MAVSSVVILMVLSVTSVLQVDGSYFPQYYPLQKTLESALITEETLYTMRQAFFPVVHNHGQEIQHVHIRICVQVIVDQALNSTMDDSCITNNYTADSSKNVTSLNWKFLWTDSALLSLITIDHLISFDPLSGVIYDSAVGLRGFSTSLQLICPVLPEEQEIKTPLMSLLSWSRSYARHHGVPPQWDKTDKGYMQEYYGQHGLFESAFNKNDVHKIRLGMVISFTLLNTLVLIGVLSYRKQCYTKVHQITSESTRLAAVTWAFMTTALLINSFYIIRTLYGLAPLPKTYPKIWACVISDLDWCASINSTKLYSDEVASLLVKLTIVPFTIVVELIIAMRLTSHTLLPFPCFMATRSRYCSLRTGKRVIQTILIWNVMVFIQIVFGVILLPASILLVIVPVTAISFLSVAFLVLPFAFTGFIAYFILKWCNPISFKQCCSITLFAHVFTTVVILSISVAIIYLYSYAIFLGVEPWSVKGSILSLLPSFLVTPLLWFAKKYFFKKDRATEVVEQSGTSMTLHNESTAHNEEEEEEVEQENVNEERRLISAL